MKVLSSLQTKILESCIAVKILKGFAFSTRQGLCLMANLSNRFVLNTKFLITFFKSGLRIFAKKVVEVWIDGIPVANNEENPKTGNQPHAISKSSNENLV